MGGDSIAVLGALGLHLAVISRAAEARGLRQKFIVAMALAHTGAIEAAQSAFAPLSAKLAVGDRLRFGLALARWDPNTGLDYLPRRHVAARAAVHLSLDQFGPAAELLDAVSTLTPDICAMRSVLALADGRHPWAREWADRVFDLRGPGVIDREIDALLSLGAFRKPEATQSDGDPVSVIMPAFNAATSIADAIASVLGQSWGSLELIVVDDGSSDGTADRAREAIAGDARARIITHAQNRGAYAARNTGLRLAQGRYVTFNDADDASHPRRIEDAVRCLSQQAKAAAHLSRLVRMDASGRLVAPRVFPFVRLHKATLTMPRATFDRVGLFEEVPTGADGEYIGRISTIFGHRSIVHDRRARVLALSRPGSLTGSPATGIMDVDANRKRLSYEEDWMRRHALGLGARPVQAPW